MIKSIQKNSFLYKNVNNIGLLYEYLGNNAFSESDLFELGDFIQQNNLYAEFLVMNYKGIKKYYVAFYLGELGYSNNFNNFNSATFYSRYDEMMNKKPMLERLKMFEGDKLQEVDLKLYNLEKADDENGRDKLLKKMNYGRNKTRNYLLQENFGLFMKQILENRDYKRFILDKEYIKDINFDFYSTDQEIFDETLNFLTGSKFFIFPFYLQGKNTKVGDMQYQELDFNSIMSRFLDKNTINDFTQKDRDITGYLYKVSMKPTTQIAVDKKHNRATFDGFASMFDFESVNDNKNMFFEYQHSLFLYTKRPDIQTLITSFQKEFGTQIQLETSDIPRDFNPQYLSHNKFGSNFHVGHLKNMGNILTTLKEYSKEQKDGMLLGREYFSNNNFKVNLFDLTGKDPTDNSLTGTANTAILGTTGAGKTHFVKERIFKKNTKDQIIMFDNMDNFSTTYNNLPDGELKDSIKLLEYGHTFPNILGKIEHDSLSLKQEVLLKVVIGHNSDLTAENKTIISAQINNYLKSIIGTTFKLDNFKQYVKALNTDYLTIEQKNLLINKLDAVNAILSQILNNEKSFDEEMYSKQKIILSYGKLMRGADKETAYYILELLLILVGGYLADKNTKSDTEIEHRYSMVLYDEAHNVIGKTKTLDTIFTGFVREIRNFKSQITMISQNYLDFPEILHGMIKFYVLLDPQNYESFKKGKTNTLKMDKDAELGKLDRTFVNFQPSLDGIVDQYESDKKLVEAEKISEKDRTRFCVFADLHASSLYILNTK